MLQRSSKRRWSNVAWWVILIIVILYFFISYTWKTKSSTDDQETPDLTKENLEDHVTLRPHKQFHRKTEDDGVKPATKTVETFKEEYKEPERTAAPKMWNIPKPKVKDSTDWVFTPKMGSCQGSKTAPLFLVVVMTTADDVAYRNGIRGSWGYPNNSHTDHINSRPNLFRTIFVMGNARSNLEMEIKEEMKESGDVLQLGFEDSKYEYTRKFINTLKWVAQDPYFKGACRPKFLLKVIDNVFINMPAVVHWLEAKYASPKKVYTGHLVHHDSPIRDSGHPLYTNEDDYPETHYPDYIRSPIYLFSWDVVDSLGAQIPNVRPLPMEDAYIGLLAVKAGVSPIHNEHFVLLGRPANVCHHLRMFFIGNISPMEHINMFRRHRNARHLPECKDMLAFHEVKHDL